MTDATWTTVLSSPLGRLRLVGGPALSGLYLEEHRHAPDSGTWREDSAPFSTTVEQLEQYFAGERLVFDIPLAPVGTPFQQAVWQALLAIPYATTVSYGAVAVAVGRPRAVRAVGLANGRNPISVIVPCHRVIGADGRLTGYGGGMPRKRWLLDHEARTAAAQPSRRHGSSSLAPAPEPALF